MEQGLIQVYTGEGKGKTTAAIGLLARAHGRGLKAALIQFLKGVETGELATLKELGIPFWQFGSGKFIMGEPSTEDRTLANAALEKVRATWNDYNLLVLDEISYLTCLQILPLKDILELLEQKPRYLELVLTGRNMPQEILDLAHLVTYMEKVKHPYDLGINAREGIEY